MKHATPSEEFNKTLCRIGLNIMSKSQKLALKNISLIYNGDFPDFFHLRTGRAVEAMKLCFR